MIVHWLWHTQRAMNSTSKRDMIDLRLVYGERLSPKEFLRLSKDRPHVIAQSRFVAPVIGASGFGSFDVKYATPILKRSAA